MYIKSSEVGNRKENDIEHDSNTPTDLYRLARSILDIHKNMRANIHIYIYYIQLSFTGVKRMVIRESGEHWRGLSRKYPSSPTRGCDFE